MILMKKAMDGKDFDIKHIFFYLLTRLRFRAFSKRDYFEIKYFYLIPLHLCFSNKLRWLKFHSNYMIWLKKHKKTATRPRGVP